MPRTHVSPVPHSIDHSNAAGARLNWLLTANDHAAEHRSRFRNGLEEVQMMLMSRPLSAERAYALFGLVLGAIAPAAIFAKLIGNAADGSTAMIAWDAGLILLCVFMNVVASLSGYLMASGLSAFAYRTERSSWARTLLVVPLIGAAWGIITGAAAGIFFFGYGAFIGAMIAAPIGMLAFLLFGILHRTLERGGMIEARHFVPVACGITTTIAALILGL